MRWRCRRIGQWLFWVGMWLGRSRKNCPIYELPLVFRLPRPPSSCPLTLRFKIMELQEFKASMLWIIYFQRRILTSPTDAGMILNAHWISSFTLQPDSTENVLQTLFHRLTLQTRYTSLMPSHEMTACEVGAYHLTLDLEALRQVTRCSGESSQAAPISSLPPWVSSPFNPFE